MTEGRDLFAFLLRLHAAKLPHYLRHSLDPLAPVRVASAEQQGFLYISLSSMDERPGDAVRGLRRIAVLDCTPTFLL